MPCSSVDPDRPYVTTNRYDRSVRSLPLAVSPSARRRSSSAARPSARRACSSRAATASASFARALSRAPRSFASRASSRASRPRDPEPLPPRAPPQRARRERQACAAVAVPHQPPQDLASPRVRRIVATRGVSPIVRVRGTGRAQRARCILEGHGTTGPFEGDVMDQIRPDHADYDEVRTLFNAMIDKRPAVIAQCATPRTSRRRWRYARAEGIDVAVRAGGHSVAGMSVNDGGLVDRRAADEGVRGRPSGPARAGWARACTWARVRPGDPGARSRHDRRTRLDDRRGRSDPRRRLGMARASVGLSLRQPRVRRPRHGRRARGHGERGPRTPTRSGRCTAAAATSVWPHRSCSRCMPLGPMVTRRV